MSNKNKHNSIIFLTTLSVYLGLVLIGAPPILAHAALTRNFDVQNEIEVKDNLDKKPNNEKIESFSDNDFPGLFIQLLNEIKDNARGEKISLPVQINFIFDAQFRLPGTRAGIGSWSSISDQNLSKLLEEAISQKFVSKINEAADYNGEYSGRGNVRLEANGNNLSLKISFTKSNAEQFAVFLNQEFSLSASSAVDILTKQIYENTKVTSENNQVFIVTRLPRGSLDEFLKSAKAQSE